MWSIASVVSVAVAASLVLLTAGVTLAIIIERRRYRKFIQHHTTAVASSSRESTNLDSHDPECVGVGLAPHRVALQNSSETWLALTCSDSREQHCSNAAQQQEPILFRRRSLRKTLKGPIKKKYRRSRRSKWIMMNQQWMSSPLSAISEFSDSSSSFPDLSQQVDASSRLPKPESSCELQTDERPLSILKTGQSAPAGRFFTRDNVLRANSTGRYNASSRTVRVSRPSSVKSDASSALIVPPSSIPTTDMVAVTKSISFKVWPSTVTGGAVNSPVISTDNLSSHRPTGVTTKTKSQGLQEFDFGIGVERITRMRSPAQLTPKGIRDRRAAAVTSLRASVSSYTEQPLPVIRCYNDQMKTEPQPRGINKALYTPKSRHSMFESRQHHGKGSLYLMSGAVMDDDDPFVTNIPHRPKSAEMKALIEKAGYDTTSQEKSLCSMYFSNKGHRRKNCVRISDLPFMPTPRKSRLLGVHDIAEEHLLEKNPISSTESISADSTDATSGKPCTNLTAISTTKQPLSDVFKQSISTTPKLLQSPNGQFHLRPPNTPMLSLSPSASPTPSRLRFQDSPILPSPAYSSSKLHAQPRQSLVKGPRSPRLIGFDVSTRSTIVTETDSCSSRTRLSKKRTASDDLRPSIKICRSTNSVRRLADESAILSSPLALQRRLPSMARDTVSPSLTYLLLPQPNHLPLPTQKITASQSSISLSNTSIWEDASVHGDSASTSRSHSRVPSPTTANDQSQPTLPTPTKRNDFLALARLDINAIPQGNSGIPVDHISTPASQFSPQTPRTKRLVEDHEAYENFVRNYGKNGAEQVRSSVQMQVMDSKRNSSPRSNRASKSRESGISPYIRDRTFENESPASAISLTAKTTGGANVGVSPKPASRISVRVSEMNKIPDTPRSMYDKDGFLKD